MTDLKQLTLLLVDDEDELRQDTAEFLEHYCGQVLQAADGRQALELLQRQNCDLVLSDIRLPVMDGLEFASRVREQAPQLPLIFCSGYVDTDYLLKALELKVTAFLRKPLKGDELVSAIAKAAVGAFSGVRLRAPRQLALESTGPALNAVTELASRAARTPFCVLLKGETGTGKSRLANIIHNMSARREGPFIAVQMGAIPEHLAESELFGYVKGAFTGAAGNKAGLVETAQGGTLFLDDIEAASPAIQAKLLRFVEEKRFTPVGSLAERMIDVRIVAASNRDLKEEAAAGRFREDLYYRLADVTIELPPLRETPEAIVPLAIKFLRETADELGCVPPTLAEEARAMLIELSWPGNVRQLKSTIRQLMLYAGHEISAREIAAVARLPLKSTLVPHTEAASAASPPPFPCSMDHLEKWSLEQALAFCEGRRMKTAEMLAMNYYTFRRRLEKHGISVGEQPGDAQD
ncbi:sigma-54 dependent transcriptional regulator [Geomonas sp.]|uniref:sigma-54-dependent transcriptional regulator n=1 Tax=Geomonas sp. TaxID=2651584 RepID=UPI002B49F4C3|nr:sigma-54 dependent transcriptional regulator [Geomonas sp.]HJV36987.1 sigma-54 dependent transcriptional regulator [Geomonas sp.]